MGSEDDFQESMTALVTRVNGDDQNAAALRELEGEIIGLRTDTGASYYAAIEGQQLQQLDSAGPTILIEGKEEDILNILAGGLDPLVAIATRRLKVNTTPAKGPLLRKLFYGK